MDRLVRLFARHRGIVAAFVCLATVLATYGVTHLKFDDDPRNIFKTNQSDYAGLEEQFADFGSDDNDCVFVIEGRELISPDAIGEIRRLVADVGEVDGVERVVSIFDAKRPSGVGNSQVPLIPKDGDAAERFERARETALTHPLVAGQLLSADGGTMLVIAKVQGTSRRLTSLEPTVKRLNQVARQHNQQVGLRVRLTGVPPVRFEVIRHIERDLVKFNVLGAVLAVVITYVVFRQISAVLMVIAAPAIGSLWVTGALGLAGVSINVLNSVVPTLVLVVGLTDSVHFLLDIKRSRAAKVGELDASMASLHHVGVACGLTSLTSAVGFASLVVARADIIRGFGLACAAGSVVSFLAVITIVPLLASTRLSKHLGEHRDREHVAASWANALVRWSTNYPVFITAVGILATLALGLVSLQLRPDSWLTENLPGHNESSLAIEHCDETFGGVMFVYAVLEWPQDETLASPAVHDALVEIHELFNSNPDTRSPMSVLNVVQALSLEGRSWPAAVRYLDRGTESLRGLVRQDKRRALVSAHVQDAGAAHGVPVIHDLQAGLVEIERRHPGLTLHLTGTTVVASESITNMISGLGSSLGLESVVIFGLMTWSFRSLWLGLVSIIPNVFPLVCVASLMVFLGMPLQFGSVIVFNICLGLAVDDTIHVMTKFKGEIAQGGDVRSAVRRSFSLVGTAVLTTTFILLVGFGVVTLSDIPALRLFGGLSCVTILSALIGELIFTPALLVTFLGRKYAAAASPHALPLTAWESHLLDQDQPGYPMTFVVRLHLSGIVKRSALQSALRNTALRHPLLSAHVHGTRGRRMWVNSNDPKPPLLWLRAANEGGLPTAGFMDLKNQNGLRVWVLEDRQASQLVLEFHKACCDNCGATQFVEDLLVAYAAQLGDCSHAETTLARDPSLLATRSPLDLTGLQMLRLAPQVLAELTGLRRIVARRPILLSDDGVPSDLSRDVLDEFPAMLNHVFEANETDELDAAARRLGTPRDGLLMRDLFVALAEWCAINKRALPNECLRMAIPVDLRSQAETAMPAANFEGLVVAERRFGDIIPGDPRGAIDLQLIYSEQWPQAQAIAVAARIRQHFPSNWRRATPTEDRPSTILFASLADALSDLALPKEKGAPVAGNVAVERVDLTQPLRPGTPAAISAVGCGRRLSITLHYDSRVFARDQAEDLLSLYVKQLSLSRAREDSKTAVPSYGELA